MTTQQKAETYAKSITKNETYQGYLIRAFLHGYEKSLNDREEKELIERIAKT